MLLIMQIDRVNKHLAELPAAARASSGSDELFKAEKDKHSSEMQVMERSLVSQAQLFNELASLYKDRDKEQLRHQQEIESLMKAVKADQLGVKELTERISKLEDKVSKV